MDDEKSRKGVTSASNSNGATKVLTLEEFVASIRINPRCYTDAFVDDPTGGSDVYLEGLQSRNGALEGDIVLVRLNPQSKWKTNPMRNNAVQKTGFVYKIVKRTHPGVAGGYLKPHSDTHALFSPTDSRIPRMLIDIGGCPLDFATQPDRYKDVLFIAQMQEWNWHRYVSQKRILWVNRTLGRARTSA